MEVTKRIYISSNMEFRLRYLKDGMAHIHSEPAKKDKDDMVEFTNLSSVWHDAKVEKQPQKVCGNNPVLVVGLRKGRISYKYLWTDMEDLWEDLELLTPLTGKGLYDKVLWAYIKDVVPYLKIEF